MKHLKWLPVLALLLAGHVGQVDAKPYIKRVVLRGGTSWSGAVGDTTTLLDVMGCRRVDFYVYSTNIDTTLSQAGPIGYFNPEGQNKAITGIISTTAGANTNWLRTDQAVTSGTSIRFKADKTTIGILRRVYPQDPTGATGTSTGNLYVGVSHLRWLSVPTASATVTDYWVIAYVYYDP